MTATRDGAGRQQRVCAVLFADVCNSGYAIALTPQHTDTITTPDGYA